MANVSRETFVKMNQKLDIAENGKESPRLPSAQPGALWWVFFYEKLRHRVLYWQMSNGLFLSAIAHFFLYRHKKSVQQICATQISYFKVPRIIKWVLVILYKDKERSKY